MLKEFKEFIMRGNVIDLAVGVIVGSAFTEIVKSLTNNLINPLLGIFLGKVDFSSWVITVAGANFRIGSFVNSVINFLIIAFIVFMMVKVINELFQRSPKPDEPKEPTSETYLREIRDLLQKEEQPK